MEQVPAFEPLDWKRYAFSFSVFPSTSTNMAVVADQREGAHQAEVLKRKLGGRFVPFRFTAPSRDFLVENAQFLVEKALVELPVEPGEARRAFLSVQASERGYEHLSRGLKDAFDANQSRDGQVRAGALGSCGL